MWEIVQITQVGEQVSGDREKRLALVLEPPLLLAGEGVQQDAQGHPAEEK